MTFKSVYNEEQGGFWPLRVPPRISQNVGLQENIKGLFIDNFNVLPVTLVCLIAWAALNRSVLDREVCT